MRLVTDRADAPQPPAPQWKDALWLLIRFAVALAILAGLWWGVPKIVWPATPLPQIPVRRGVKLPPSRSAQKSRMSPSVPDAPGSPGQPGATQPRRGFEETRIYDNKGGALRNRDDR